MISFEEALNLIKAEANSFGEEYISIFEADNRILAEDLKADRDYPPFNRAAMDGFALSFSDWEKGIREYRIQETIFAGQEGKSILEPGNCYQIMTGAAVPPSANVIIRREDSEQREDMVKLIDQFLKPFKNIAKEGEDAKKGELLIKAPALCSPSVISLLATVGKTKIRVKKKPTISIITTGNEVKDPEYNVQSFQIRNSNQYLLRSLVAKWGIKPLVCTHVEDEKELIREVLEGAIKNDITIINGGVSAGNADFVPQVLTELRVRKIFHKVKIKPGKPLWFGASPSGGVVFALPGNPLSCLTTFTIFVETYLYQCMGFPERKSYRYPLSNQRKRKVNITEIFPVTINPQNGRLEAQSFNGSGDITAGLGAQGLAVHPEEKEEVALEDKVTLYPFSLNS